MMRKTIQLLVVAVCLAAAGAGQGASASEDDWRVFHSVEGGFQVEMPGVPVASQSVDHSFLGSVTTHLFTVDSPTQEFTVEYSDLPHLALVLGGPTTILKKAKKALLKDVQGEEVTFRLFREKGNDRAELSYLGDPDRNPGVIGFARFFLQGERIYVLHVMLSHDERINPDRITQFFESFRKDA